ncbi:hypothetical protein J5681_03360 [bacterium]|nr:hypothetical protein [bacterium]
MNPEKNNSFIKRVSKRLVFVFAIIAAVYIYRGGVFLPKTFEFQPETVLDKNITETGKITYASGKISTFENKYKAHEKRTFANSILTLEGKTDGDFDPVLKPLIKSDTYSQKIDLSTSYCPENFVPQYPTALRNHIYFMPRTQLFDGQIWEIVSCSGKFVCTYSVSMKEEKKSTGISCSGSLGDTKTMISGTAVINDSLDGFSRIKMTIVSENNDLLSTWNFEEENSTSSKISK